MCEDIALELYKWHTYRKVAFTNAAIFSQTSQAVEEACRGHKRQEGEK